jgi:hypothetical protein
LLQRWVDGVSLVGLVQGLVQYLYEFPSDPKDYYGEDELWNVLENDVCQEFFGSGDEFFHVFVL